MRTDRSKQGGEYDADMRRGGHTAERRATRDAAAAEIEKTH